MNILVTGGAGFIGSWIVDYFINEDHYVAVIDNMSTGSWDNLNKKAKLYGMNITDPKISEIFKIENFDYVFHLAAQIDVRESINNPKDDANTNILGSLNIIQNCVKYNVKKIIFSSTGGAIYGDNVNIPTYENESRNPQSPYGIAKLTIENYLKFFKINHDLDYTILRYSNVYGPRQNNSVESGVITIFINNLINNKKSFIFGDGTKTRDYVYIKDVVNANVKALELSGTFNVGTGIETNLNELYEKIKKISNSDVDSVHKNEIIGELKRSCLNTEKLRGENWVVEYDLENGLKEAYDYFMEMHKGGISVYYP